MIILSLKASPELKERIGGAFPVSLLPLSQMPVYSPADDESESVRAGVVSEEDIGRIGQDILMKAKAFLLPKKEVILAYQKDMQNHYKNQDLWLLLSIEYIFAVKDEDVDDESPFRFYSVGISEGQRNEYRLDEQFFAMLEKADSPIEHSLFGGVKAESEYALEFFLSLSDVMVFREKVLLGQHSQGKEFVDIDEERFREEFLTPAEREIVYGQR